MLEHTDDCIRIEMACTKTGSKKSSERVISKQEADRLCKGLKRKKPKDVKKEREKKDDNIFLKNKKKRKGIAQKAMNYAKDEMNVKITNLKKTLPKQLSQIGRKAFYAKFPVPSVGDIAWEATKSAAGRSIWKFALKKIPWVGWGKAAYDAEKMRSIGTELWWLEEKFLNEIKIQIKKFTKQMNDLIENTLNKNLKDLEKMKNSKRHKKIIASMPENVIWFPMKDQTTKYA